MRSTSIITFLVGLFLLAPGCRSKQNLVPLERENRNLEDALFELEYELEVCREENAALRESQGTGRREDRSESSTIYSKKSDFPSLDLEQLVPPSVELGPRVSPSDQIPDKFRLPDRPDTSELPEAEPFDGTSPILPTPSQAPPGSDSSGGSRSNRERSASANRGPRPPLVDNNLVARVTIDSELTGGLDADGDARADGLAAVIQPRDEDGRLLRAAAPVSVVVLDPALPGESARVARWDFSADDVARAFDRSSSAEGLRLEMLWPKKPPVNNRLHVFVRYLTSDGRKCESDHLVQVDLPGQPVERWSATRSAKRESSVVSRTPPVSQTPADWRRPARIQPAVSVEPTPAPVPAMEELPRMASRPAKPMAVLEAVPAAGPAPAPPTRQLPVWSPER